MPQPEAMALLNEFEEYATSLEVPAVLSFIASAKKTLSGDLVAQSKGVRQVEISRKSGHNRKQVTKRSGDSWNTFGNTPQNGTALKWR